MRKLVIHLRKVKDVTIMDIATTFNAHNSPLEGATRLKQVPLDFSFRLL